MQASSLGGASVAMLPLQIWTNALGICEIYKTNMLISPLKSCVTLPRLSIASVEPPVESNHFQTCTYVQYDTCKMFCGRLSRALCNKGAFYTDAYIIYIHSICIMERIYVHSPPLVVAAPTGSMVWLRAS
jgi:hypothetical protein